MSINKSIIAAVSAVFFIGGVHAVNPEGQEGYEGYEGMERTETPAFEQLDRDGNGYISRAESAVLPCLRDNFDDIETDSDEGLDRAEYRKAVSRHC